MRKRIRKRRWLVGTSIVLVLVLVVAGFTVVGNDFRFEQRTVEIPVPNGKLEGVLTLPREGSARGLVVMIHGDGPVDATQDGLYSPWFEGAADAGFASLSWSKPGVGGSTGSWLEQSMDDRATEVDAAINWAKSQSDIPTDSIVLWGASQAGWVMPKVVSERDDIDGEVAVGTAINWLRQGRYNLLAQLEDENASESQRQHAIEESDQTRKLLEEGASYDVYLDHTTDDPPMSAERWGFVARNSKADAKADLRSASKRKIPILLLAGEHDRNVDMPETERVYRQIFGDRLTVRQVDAVHSMARPIVDRNDLVGFAVGVVWPRKLLADGVIDSYKDFLESVPDGS